MPRVARLNAPEQISNLIAVEKRNAVTMAGCRPGLREMMDMKSMSRRYVKHGHKACGRFS